MLLSGKNLILFIMRLSFSEFMWKWKVFFSICAVNIGLNNHCNWYKKNDSMFWQWQCLSVKCMLKTKRKQKLWEELQWNEKRFCCCIDHILWSYNTGMQVILQFYIKHVHKNYSFFFIKYRGIFNLKERKKGLEGRKAEEEKRK